MVDSDAHVFVWREMEGAERPEGGQGGGQPRGRRRQERAPERSPGKRRSLTLSTAASLSACNPGAALPAENTF